MKSFTLLIALLFISISPLKAQTIKEAFEQEIEGFSKMSKDAGVLALVSTKDERMVYAAGFSDLEKRKAAKTKDLFEIGSASKMFTAISILQLIEQGKLSLDTPIANFYKDELIKKLANYKGDNNWDDVTVAMLLNHTSGFIDYLNVYEDDEKAMKIFAIKGKIYSFDELINLAINHGDANFKPGEQFKYCNTGYVILGDIISKVSGINWRDYIQTNILDVVGMKNTFFGSRISKKFAKRTMKGNFKGKPSFMPPTLAGSAGELISNVKDLEKFLIAWQGGKLFQKKETLEMQRTKGFHQMYEQTNTLTYGYGVMLMGGFYGHGGQTFGFQSFVTYNPEKEKASVIGANDASAEVMLFFMSMEKIGF